MKIGIIAGESSGDQLAAGLISAIKKRYPDAQFEGIAGPAMIAAGCEAIYPADKLAVMGFEALLHYRELKGIQNQIVAHFIQNPPDLFIGVDAPDFNLTVERKLKQAGIKAAHYVSPSVWAWRQYRVKKIARSVDLVMTLFPFEADFYRDHNVPVAFVGHPFADAVPLETDKGSARQALGLSVQGKVLAILPGSRMSEVTRLAEPMLQAAAIIVNQCPELQFVAPMATPKVREQFELAYKNLGIQLPLTIVDGQAREAMAAADSVLLASGTAALEGMLMKRPMVVTYKFSKIGGWLARRLVKTKFVSLPNILAGKEMAPELLLEAATAENMAKEVLTQLTDVNSIAAIQECYLEIHKQLRRDASNCAAEAVLKLLA